MDVGIEGVKRRIKRGGEVINHKTHREIGSKYRERGACLTPECSQVMRPIRRTRAGPFDVCWSRVPWYCIYVFLKALPHF